VELVLPIDVPFLLSFQSTLAKLHHTHQGHHTLPFCHYQPPKRAHMDKGYPRPLALLQREQAAE
jgi:hypothetical protein